MRKTLLRNATAEEISEYVKDCSDEQIKGVYRGLASWRGRRAGTNLKERATKAAQARWAREKGKA